MEPFLKETLRTIVAAHPEGLANVTLVFNNRRPTLFVKHYLREMLGETFFLPQTIVFDDLIAELGDNELVPNEFLLFELYDIHRRINPTDKRTLDQFMPMADMMLADFSEVDRYMVDVKDIYGNLHDLKEIGEWQIDNNKLTPFQRDYLKFYKSIYTYYLELNRLLASRRQAYYGMAYRNVAENIDTLLDQQPQRTLYFLGFNALSKCEEKIIQCYIRRGMGTYLPDGDRYYIDDKTQEAGYFLRKHQSLSSSHDYREHFAEGRRIINIVKVPDSVSQAKYAGMVLQQITASDNGIPLSDTALVLGDEGLVTSVLNSLPDSMEQANITMGIPFTQSEMHSLTLTLFSLYANSRTTNHGDRLYYHKDLTDLLGNKYIGGLIGINALPKRAKRYMTDRNVIYASLPELDKMLASMNGSLDDVRFVFDADTTKPFSLLDTAKHLIELIATKCLISNESKEHAAMECLTQIIDYLLTLRERHEAEGARAIPIDDVQTLRKIYLRIAQRRNISFIGLPLSGLQILGVLETRCLDFRRVILLSANEGVIPSSRSNNTLIPNSLKRFFKMPTYYERDAVYAYNFFHLLQRAEEVCIVSSDDGIKDSESRFVQQLRSELAKHYKDNVEINEIRVASSNHNYAIQATNQIEKDEAIIAQLQKKRYSPSSLNSYIECPLRFYYENLLHIRKDDEISDTLESSDLGTVIHQCLEDIYKPFKNKSLDKAALVAAIDTVPSRIETLMENCFTHGEIHRGKTDLMRSVAISQVVHFLQHEIKTLETGHRIEIVQLEETMNTPVLLPLGSEQKPMEVAFNTKADRIDRIDGLLRVIDYKSGRVTDDDIAINTLDPNEWVNLPAKWFQVMFYAWYYSRLHNVDEEITTGLCALQRLGGDFMPASINKNTILTKETMQKFEQTLTNLLSEIMDPATPFAARPNKLCSFCTIAPLCSKTNDSTTTAATSDNITL